MAPRLAAYRAQNQTDLLEMDSKSSQRKEKITIQAASTSVMYCSELCRLPQRILSGVYNAWQLKDPSAFHSFSLREMTVKKKPSEFAPVKTMQVAWKKMCFVTDPWIMESIFEHHRLNSDLFGNLEQLQIFDTIFHRYIFSPPMEAHKRMYQVHVGKLLSNRELKNHIVVIQKLSNQIIDSIKPGVNFNVSKRIGVLVCGIILNILGLDDVDNDKVIILIEKFGDLIEKMAANPFFKPGEQPTVIKKQLTELTDFESALEADTNLKDFFLIAKDFFPGTEIEQKKFTEALLCGFLFAGIENTKISIPNLLNLLGHFTGWQEQLDEEYTKAQTSSEDAWLLRYLSNQSTVLHRVFMEGLRLNPPTFANGRYTLQDIEICDRNGDVHTIAKGTNIFLMHYLMGRDSQYWGDDANTFNPDRFLEDSVKEVPQLMVFAKGPTSCPGRKLAEFETKIFVLELVKRYRWTATADFNKIDSKSVFLFKPNDDIHIFIRDK